MAESLMAPAPEVDQSAVDAGYGDDFEGFANAGDPGVPGHAGLAAQAHQPDGRPHAQRQPVDAAPPDPAPVFREPSALAAEESGARVAMGNTLADARRVAEGSGMLQGEQEGNPAGELPATSVSPTPASSPALSPDVHPEAVSPASVVAKSLHDSPFHVSSDQSQTQPVPVARQVSPAVDVAPPVVPAAAPAPPVAPAAAPPAAAPPAPAPAPPAPAPEADLRSADSSPDEGAGGSERGAAHGPFLARLQRFSAVLRRDLDASAMFLIDNEGQVLLDEVENPKLIQVARTLANASYRATRQTAGSAAVGNLHVKIGASATLEVIPVRSRYGLLILGVIFPAPLGAERVQQVAGLLYKTVEPDSGR